MAAVNKNTLTIKDGRVAQRLVSLTDHNAKIAEAYRLQGQPKPNGIACPSCGTEMLDSSPSVTLPTEPPKKYIHCASCGLQSIRYC